MSNLTWNVTLFGARFVRKVPHSYHHHVENGVAVKIPIIKPADTLKYLLEQYPWTLLGGLVPGEHTQLVSTFWRQYKKEHASHEIFRMAENGEVQLEHTVPLVLHGDGGRTTKKQPIEVVSFCPVLGLDSDQKPLKCTCQPSTTYCGKRKRSALAQRLNLKNTSFATRFLMFAYPSKKYKSTPGLLRSLLRAVSDDLGAVCRSGLSTSFSGNDFHFNFAILGIKGDQEWHAKSGLLTRTYMNVGYKNSIPCCSDCLAGGPGVPFEDASSQAAWRSTIYTVAPWTSTPPFASIPFCDWDSGEAAFFFKRDIFHIFRLGIARNFLGSALVYLAGAGHFDSPQDTRNLDDRLARAWARFQLWCVGNGASPAGIRSFSRQKLHIPVAGSFPWVGCKASDTILLLRWMLFFCRIEMNAGHQSNMLRTIAAACENGLHFQGVYRHGVWLNESCRAKLLKNAQRFTTAYAVLAREAYQQNMQLWAMVPKFHSFDHVKVALEPAADKDFYLNPATFCCSMSEDFIGRISRHSRRVSYIQVEENTLLAYRVKAKFQLSRLAKARGL